MMFQYTQNSDSSSFNSTLGREIMAGAEEEGLLLTFESVATTLRLIEDKTEAEQSTHFPASALMHPSYADLVLLEPWRRNWHQKMWHGSKGNKPIRELRVCDHSGFRRRAGCVVFETSQKKRVLCVRVGSKKKNGISKNKHPHLDVSTSWNKKHESWNPNPNPLVFDESSNSISSHTNEDHQWIFPAGGVEVGECMIEAARRELEEEAGYCIIDPKANDTLKNVQSLGWIESSSKKTRTIYYSVSGVVKDVAPTSTLFDHRERKFFDVEVAKKYLKPVFLRPLDLALSLRNN